MAITFQNMRIDVLDDIYLFSSGNKHFRARKNDDHSDSACLFSYNDQPFDLVSITDSDLLVADVYLKEVGFHWISIEYEGDQYSFPLFETLEPLAEIDEGIHLLLTYDIYDGPISGLIKHHEDLYWFEWCQDTVTQPPYGRRTYALRKLPQSMIEATDAWVTKSNRLTAELDLIANLHIYPVSDWQQQQLRSVVEVQADLAELDKDLLDWRRLPITARMPEIGQQFAAISTFILSGEESCRFEQWQRDVAEALMNEDQAALDELFVNPPLPESPWDIYRVDIVKGGKPFTVLRDSRGKPLSETFWMTSRHSVQNFTHLVPSCKAGGG